MSNENQKLLDYVSQNLAPNYSPLPVILKHGEGVWVYDVNNKKYLDFLSSYSALNFGHLNSRITKVAKQQLDTLTLTSRAFLAEDLCLLAKELAEFLATEMSIFMNSGAEAVETAIKAARRWGYEKKGVEQNCAEVIVFNGNFHGRTTTIISFSDSDDSRKNFGPYTPGFKFCDFGDIDSVRSQISKNTVGILIEPIQGEGGIIIPPDGFIKQLREICDQENILLIDDEIQTGLCRTGKVMAIDHEGVKPDLYIIAKSLGGGIVPISAVSGRKDVLECLVPGSHGSTFGGNPFACAIAREVLKLIKDEHFEKRSTELGEYFINGIRAINSDKLIDIRGKGLFVGIEFDHNLGKAKQFCQKLAEAGGATGVGLLCKDTRDYTVRLIPPLVIKKEELDMGLEILEKVLKD